MKEKSLFTKQVFLLTALLLLSSFGAKAQEPTTYLSADELPNAVYWLPAPPAPGTLQFMYDISQYYWGKEQRADTARANKAIREAAYEVADMVRLFSAAFGIEKGDPTLLKAASSSLVFTVSMAPRSILLSTICLSRHAFT